VGLFIDGWLEMGAVRPRFVWPDLGPQVNLVAPNLFGNLAVQLLVTISMTKAFLACTECGRAYIPSREPKPGERNYCPKCGRRAANRRTQRERRASLRPFPRYTDTD
jgi:hypothetical protein